MKNMTRIATAALLAISLTATVQAAAPESANGVISLPIVVRIPVDQRTCAAKTASGLGYTVLRKANGKGVTASDQVKVNYLGYLGAEGQIFDQGIATEFPVGGVIPGFSEGIMLMQTGSIFRLCIPAALGYGASPAGQIPPNADLVFQVELLTVEAPPAVPPEPAQ